MDLDLKASVIGNFHLIIHYYLTIIPVKFIRFGKPGIRILREFSVYKEKVFVSARYQIYNCRPYTALIFFRGFADIYSLKVPTKQTSGIRVFILKGDPLLGYFFGHDITSV